MIYDFIKKLMMENKGHIVISANVSWYLYNFRKNTIKELISLGHDLTVVSSRDHTLKNLNPWDAK